MLNETEKVNLTCFYFCFGPFNALCWQMISCLDSGRNKACIGKEIVSYVQLIMFLLLPTHRCLFLAVIAMALCFISEVFHLGGVAIPTMDGTGTSVFGAGNSAPDMDPFTLSPFDTLDGYTELGAGSSVDDSVMSAFCFSPNSEEQAEADASISDGDDSSDMSGSVDLPKSIHDAAITLPERMLKALAILQESSNVFGAILVQVWMPVKHGECQVLTTSDQPFLLDQSLTGYREISRQFMFSAAGGPGQFPGLPGRVFMSGMPEWTSNVMYYHDSEYLRAEHAVRHEVRGSLAVPVFDFSGPLDSCCVVLEVVMTQEKDNFCSEIDDISKALQVSTHIIYLSQIVYLKLEALLSLNFISGNLDHFPSPELGGLLYPVNNHRKMVGIWYHL